MKQKAASGYYAWPAQIRKNWGYWDGVAARKAGRWPQWCRSWQSFDKAHFDKAYSEGFRIGWYGEPAPKGANP